MSPISSFLLVVVGFLLFAVPIFYFIFFKGSAGANKGVNAIPESPRIVDLEQVRKIQAELGVTLPPRYIAVLLGDRPDFLDSTAVLDDARQIIDFTLKYRYGAYGLPSWPNSYVYIGDEADACPYVIDCENGNVLRLDKGNISINPLADFETFDNFVEAYREVMEE
ncbi:SMI1/KNR4 family protein [Microbulbifer hainanensis]|uniref:SMI1/KNR4 family protein n=1 Tax=Microbulbifer hainanensis TaxID=2735675 RepID=UPI0018668E52|nr:SMI1/KNR4 family protein [Microbulbifer hainanensis]